MKGFFPHVWYARPGPQLSLWKYLHVGDFPTADYHPDEPFFDGRFWTAYNLWMDGILRLKKLQTSRRETATNHILVLSFTVSFSSFFFGSIQSRQEVHL